MAPRSAIMAAFAPILVAASPALAADQDVELWTVGIATGPISGKVLGSMEVSIRSSDEGTRHATVLLRPSIGYQVTPKLSLWAGYTRATIGTIGRPLSIENRYFQQASWTIGKVAGGTLTSRTRLEQRTVMGRNDTGWRARQQLRWTKPIAKEGTSVVLSSEVFVALNSTDFGASAGLDQTRNFAGINLPLAKGFTVEGGYMNRYVRRAGVPDRLDHILPITATYRF